MLPATPIRTADGSHTLHSERYRETFHSVNGAATESRHVFLGATGVAGRLSDQQATRVLEIGFGLGLNCLLTTDLACQHQTPLDYHALENDPSVLLCLSTMQYEDLLLTSNLHERLIAGLSALPQLDPAAPSREVAMQSGGPKPPNTTQPLPPQTLCITLGENVTLTLHLCDAARNELPAGQFDAIYLDAFSPDSNPECWSTEFFSRLRKKIADGGALTTYSAKGSVRRALMAANFNVKKMPGPPGKREMLCATE